MISFDYLFPFINISMLIVWMSDVIEVYFEIYSSCRASFIKKEKNISHLENAVLGCKKYGQGRIILTQAFGEH